MTTCRTVGYRSAARGGSVGYVSTTRTTTSPVTRTLLPGLGLVAAGVAVSYLVNLALPPVSALTAAVLLGVVVGNLPILPATARPGLTWATRRLLRAGVVLLGLQLAVPQVLALGGGTLLAVVVTVAVTFLGTIALGRLLRLPRGLSLLVGTGFAICGASAIAAMEGVVDREEEDVASGVALVTIFGSVSMLVLPMLAGPLGLSDADYGRLAGMSVHEVAQVVAAASPLGAAAVTVAVVAKLSRVVLLAPMVAAVSLVERRRRPATEGKRPPLVPLFVLGFLGMVAVRSLGVLPGGVLDATKTLTTLLLAGALFGLGCGVRIGALVRTGPRALLLGLLSTLLVTGVAFAALRVIGG
ncbi:putative sulfate exporter family transporter [Solihabitans fulvus]|uniref:Putative sulfate exporter family transporter n=1 Tax=Solihabitans fulvus TaxID=1892852 RepID=A0A5B2X8I5_9PSEU|nr:putative sulfate exporter family transporter [Solihabitans fulvus]KAA2259560.1 putative sulfate exporter family transporter [Solihabitans fulvus]